MQLAAHSMTARLVFQKTTQQDLDLVPVDGGIVQYNVVFVKSVKTLPNIFTNHSPNPNHHCQASPASIKFG